MVGQGLAAILIMTEFSLLREAPALKPPKATAKPYTRHILGIDSGLQSHTKATPRPHQSHTKATPKPHQGHTKATPRPHQSHTKATPKPHQTHPKANSSGYFNGWRARKPPVLPGSWP